MAGAERFPHRSRCVANAASRLCSSVLATLQDHLGELYARTGRLKLAATHWERAVDEWNKSMPGDFDQQDLARVQKKLESTKIKLAQQTRNE